MAMAVIELPKFDTKAMRMGFTVGSVLSYKLLFFFFFFFVISVVLHTHTDPSAMNTVLCLWCLTSGISVIRYDAQNTKLWV